MVPIRDLGAIQTVCHWSMGKGGSSKIVTKSEKAYELKGAVTISKKLFFQQSY